MQLESLHFLNHTNATYSKKMGHRKLLLTQPMQMSSWNIYSYPNHVVLQFHNIRAEKEKYGMVSSY